MAYGYGCTVRDTRLIEGCTLLEDEDDEDCTKLLTMLQLLN